MKTIKIIFLLAFTAVILNGCISDDLPVYYQKNVALIINQGNYSDKNGSVSYYYEESGTVENNLLKSANNTDLGASIQSVELSSSGLIYVICNNVDKIEVFDAYTCKAKGAPFIGSNLSTPRFITGDGHKLYITNWGDESVNNGFKTIYPESYVLAATYNNNNNWAVERKIECGSDAEDILYLDNKLYVATGEGVAVINTDTYEVDVIEAPVGFNGGAKALTLSKGNLLWVSYPDDQKLVAINLVTHTILDSYDMPLDLMGQISADYYRTKIYSYKTTFDANNAALWAAIYEFDVDNKTYREFYRGMEGSCFYSVGVSPFTGNVYTADINDSMVNSLLLVINPSGNVIQQKEVGVRTCGMRFFRIQQEE